jgi:hypothetical protein
MIVRGLPLDFSKVEPGQPVPLFAHKFAVVGSHRFYTGRAVPVIEWIDPASEPLPVTGRVTLYPVLDLARLEIGQEGKMPAVKVLRVLSGTEALVTRRDLGVNEGPLVFIVSTPAAAGLVDDQVVTLEGHFAVARIRKTADGQSFFVLEQKKTGEEVEREEQAATEERASQAREQRARDVRLQEELTRSELERQQAETKARTDEKTEKRAEALLRFAKGRLDYGTASDRALAKKRLQELIRDYADTPAAAEARELLRKVD